MTDQPTHEETTMSTDTTTTAGAPSGGSLPELAAALVAAVKEFGEATERCNRVFRESGFEQALDERQRAVEKVRKARSALDAAVLETEGPTWL